MQAELKERRKTNPDLIIRRGKIIARPDPSSIAGDSSAAQNLCSDTASSVVVLSSPDDSAGGN